MLRRAFLAAPAFLTLAAQDAKKRQPDVPYVPATGH